MWEDEDEDDERESATLTLDRQQLAALDAAMATIEATLAELVEHARRVAADPVELGGRQEIFCREALMRLMQNPQLTAGDPMFDTAHEALRALDQLRPGLQRLQRLGGHGTRIESMLGGHVLSSALIGYALLDANGQARGLEALRAGLSWRRRGRIDGDVDDSPGFDEELPQA